jgi:hypothetical protein
MAGDGLQTVKRVLTDKEYIQWCKIVYCDSDTDGPFEVFWPEGATFSFYGLC